MDPPKVPSDRIELSPALLAALTDAQPRLFGFLLKRLGDPDQTHEVLQEVNLVICGRGGEYQAGSNFMAWAFSIARFQVLAFRKRMSRDRLVFPEDLAFALDSLDQRMFEQHQELDRQTALGECLKKLPQKSRDLLMRRYAESVSVKAIAADLDRTANSVSLLLHRMREQLMLCIEQKLKEA